MLNHREVEKRRQIRSDKLHAARIKARAKIEGIANKGRLTSDRLKGVGLHFLSAFYQREIKPREWVELVNESTAHVHLVDGWGER